MADYFDTQGRPLEMLEWARLLGERRLGEDRWWKVAHTNLSDDVSISTVWLGLNHNWDDGPPHIFESMVFGGTLDGETRRYSTWEQAEAGHAELVEKARNALETKNARP